MKLQKDVPLRGYTTLGVGGTASNFVSVATLTELEAVVVFAHKHALKIHVLGGGSNVLISDATITGLVIHMKIKGIQTTVQGDSVTLTVAAGESFDDVVLYAVTHGWWGLENLSHIPGTVGATPIQNVGAYGVEVANIISEVRVFNYATQSYQTFKTAECLFSYRSSVFKNDIEKKHIIVSVTFTLSTIPKRELGYKDIAKQFLDTPEPSLADIRKAVITIRSKKFPNWHEIGTAGSFFKNPTIPETVFNTLKSEYPNLPGFQTHNRMVKISLAWILDHVLSIKGYQKGFVATYEAQPLVLVAHTGATASEIEQFADELVEKVKNKIGITIEWEVTKIDNFI